MLTCPICNKSRATWTMYSKRVNARCTHCRSLERHRAVALILRALTPAYDPAQPLTVLHIRPFLELPLFRGVKAPKTNNTALKTQVNVLNLPFEDGEADLIIHNHIMEHVKNDKKGFCELKRVLKPGGFMVFTVPAWGTEMVEGVDDGSAASRLKHYGQRDHVRLYSRMGCAERLLECGFGSATFAEVGDHCHEDVVAAAALGPANGAFVAR